MCLLADQYQLFAGDVLADCAGESCGIQFLKLHVFRVGRDIADDDGLGCCGYLGQCRRS